MIITKQLEMNRVSALNNPEGFDMPLNKPKQMPCYK